MKNSHFQIEGARNSKLNILLQSFLKQHNITDCRVGNVKNGQLLIEVPTSTWKIRLQFMQSEILSVMRSKVPSLIKIKVVVNPRLNISQSKVEKLKKVAIKRAALMPRDIAESFLAIAKDADPTLKSALISLAQYSKK